MHILLIHQIFVTPSQGGGTRHYEMAKYLVEHGHKVSVITSKTDYLSGRDIQISKNNISGLKIYHIPGTSKIHKTILNKALGFFKFSIQSYTIGKSLKDVDIIWGTSPPLFQVITAYALKIKLKAIFIFEVRDLWIDFARELGIVNNRLVYHIFKKIELFLYKKSDQIIVNSPGFIPYIQKLIPNKKIHLFPNGVISSSFEITSDHPCSIKELNNDSLFKILYTGNIGIANDIETIIKTAQSLVSYTSIKFFIIGGGLKKDYFTQYCKENKIFNIQFIDAIPKSEIPNVLNKADVCLASLKDIPLFSTVYPNKIFDYMAAKKPTILSINGVTKDIIMRSNGGIIIPPENEAAMKNAILAYVNNRELIIEHGANASKYVKQYFERNTICAKFESFLKTLIK